VASEKKVPLENNKHQKLIANPPKVSDKDDRRSAQKGGKIPNQQKHTFGKDDQNREVTRFQRRGEEGKKKKKKKGGKLEI